MVIYINFNVKQINEEISDFYVYPHHLGAKHTL